MSVCEGTHVFLLGFRRGETLCPWGKVFPAKVSGAWWMLLEHGFHGSEHDANGGGQHQSHTNSELDLKLSNIRLELGNSRGDICLGSEQRMHFGLLGINDSVLSVLEH